MQREMCIIIHGFTGSPLEIKPLADALETLGYEVITPLLPGHHINKALIKKATSSDWLQAIEEIVRQAIEENKKIHMIGFSMGAMIASIVAYRYAVSTLVLLSPAVYVLSPNLLKIRMENLVHKKKEKQPSNQTMFKMIPILRSAFLYNFFQFQKIVRQARRVFQHISIPLCIIHGKRDETADPYSSKLIYRAASSKDKELHFLPVSKHHICHDCEVKDVIQTVVKFLDKYHSKGKTKNSNP